MNKRECGDCTKCCEGWLSATIYEKTMHKGRPCFYLDKCNNNCSIYENRPKNPCKDFSCAWIDNENDIFPLWMKPSLSNVIITKRTIMVNNKQFDYYEMVEAGGKVQSEVLNWVIHWALMNQINLHYEVAGNKFIFGEPDFADSLASISGKVTKM